MNTKNALFRLALAACVALAGWVAAPPPPTQAGTFIVDSGVDGPDNLPGDSVCATLSNACSLRAAIMEANAQPGPDTIQFAPTLNGVPIQLTIQGSDEDLSLTGDLDVLTGTVTLLATSAQQIVIDANGALSSAFEVHTDGELTLSNVTVVGAGPTTGPSVLRVNGGTLRVNESTIRGSAQGWGVEQVAGSSVLNNVTITGNALGGISVVTGTATVVNATIAEPIPTPGVTGVALAGGTLSVRDSIIANHGTDCVGAVSFGGNNIVETAGAGCDVAGTSQADPQLGVLNDNGGPTQTMAPAPGSPAINGGGATCVAIDQRGVSRPRGGQCDLGAYEYPVARIGTPAPLTVPDASASVPITATLLGGGVPFPVSISYGTANGTAVGGTDFVSVSNGVLTFPANATTGSALISTLRRTAYTGQLSFSVNFSTGAGGQVALMQAPTTLPVNITDAEQPPTVGFGQVSITVEETAGTLGVQVNLSNVSAFTTTVNFNTSGGTALSGRDYLGTSGTLTFGPGETQKTINVAILNNTRYFGPGRAFTLNLSGPNGASLRPGASVATISINEDEPAPTLSFPNSGFSVLEAAGSGVVTATLSNEADIPITVNLATSDGTGPSAALAGRDYTTLNTTLTFAPGQTTRSTAISLINNGQFTEARTFRVALSNPAPAPVSLGTPNDALVTIVDAQSPPDVQFLATSYSVNRTANTAAITVTLSVTPTLLTTVAYTMAGNTAVAGVDFVPRAGTLSFNPGQTSAVITATILNSGVYVGDRQFSVGLSAPVNANLGDPVLASVNIRDNNARRLYLPVTAQAYNPFRESEPNNGFSSANGPLVSGATYLGRYSGPASLDNDYWAFTTSRAGAVTITLTNMNPSNQVMLMTAGGARLGFAGGDPFTIAVNISAAGTYYVRVVVAPGQTSDYQLQVAYP